MMFWRRWRLLMARSMLMARSGPAVIAALFSMLLIAALSRLTVTGLPGARADEVAETYGDRFMFLQGRFGDVRTLLQAAGVDKVDGFVLDLGVSSMQLDEQDRGFSFRYDAPLDMRMDQDADAPTAADIIKTWPEEELANVIYRYGEERHSRRVARAIVRQRAEAEITTTAVLADLVRQAVPRSKKDDIHPATRTFQALRIAVNEELLELEKALAASPAILNEGGGLLSCRSILLKTVSSKNICVRRRGKSRRGHAMLPKCLARKMSIIRCRIKRSFFQKRRRWLLIRVRARRVCAWLYVRL